MIDKITILMIKCSSQLLSLLSTTAKIKWFEHQIYEDLLLFSFSYAFILNSFGQLVKCWHRLWMNCDVHFFTFFFSLQHIIGLHFTSQITLQVQV